MAPTSKFGLVAFDETSQSRTFVSFSLITTFPLLRRQLLVHHHRVLYRFRSNIQTSRELVVISPAHTSGTVCQLPFEPQRSRLWRSRDISRPTHMTGTHGTSEDYLGCALQICVSSSYNKILDTAGFADLGANVPVNIEPLSCSIILKT